MIGIGLEPKDIDNKWVPRRVMTALDSILVTVGMKNVSELLFTYEMRRKMKIKGVNTVHQRERGHHNEPEPGLHT